MMTIMTTMTMGTMWFSLGAHSGTSNSSPGGFCLSGSELWMVVMVMMMVMMVLMVVMMVVMMVMMVMVVMMVDFVSPAASSGWLRI